MQNVCKCAQYHTQALRHICSLLTADMAKSLRVQLVNSRFDNTNAVLYGTSEHNLVKLPRAQNALALIVTFTKRMDHNRTSTGLATDQKQNQLQSGKSHIQSSTNWLP